HWTTRVAPGRPAQNALNSSRVMTGLARELIAAFRRRLMVTRVPVKEKEPGAFRLRALQCRRVGSRGSLLLTGEPGPDLQPSGRGLGLHVVALHPEDQTVGARRNLDGRVVED